MALLTNSLRDRKQRPGWAGQPIRTPRWARRLYNPN